MKVLTCNYGLMVGSWVWILRMSPPGETGSKVRWHASAGLSVGSKTSWWAWCAWGNERRKTTIISNIFVSDWKSVILEVFNKFLLLFLTNMLSLFTQVLYILLSNMTAKNLNIEMSCKEERKLHTFTNYGPKWAN